MVYRLVPSLLAREAGADDALLLGRQWLAGQAVRLRDVAVDDDGVVEVVIVEDVDDGLQGRLGLGQPLGLRRLDRVVLELLQHRVVEVVEAIIRKLVHDRQLMSAAPLEQPSAHGYVGIVVGNEIATGKRVARYSGVLLAPPYLAHKYLIG